MKNDFKTLYSIINFTMKAWSINDRITNNNSVKLRSLRGKKFFYFLIVRSSKINMRISS